MQPALPICNPNLIIIFTTGRSRTNHGPITDQSRPSRFKLSKIRRSISKLFRFCSRGYTTTSERSKKQTREWRLSIFNPNLIIFTTIIYVYVRRIDMKSLTNMNILYSTSLKRSGNVIFEPETWKTGSGLNRLTDWHTCHFIFRVITETVCLHFNSEVN